MLIVSILATLSGIPFFIRTAQALELSDISDTLSTSAPGALSNHTITFTTPTGVVDDGSTIAVTFPTGFTMGSVGEDDIDIADDGVDLTTGGSCGSVHVAVSVLSQTITLEVCNGGGGTIGAGSIVTIEVGTHATSSGTGANRITNHASTGGYELTVAGTMADAGYTQLVIVDQVRLTGTVETYLDFSVTGVGAGETVNADATTTFATTTATSVVYGIVAPGTEYVLAQDLSVVTNAENGFVVTVSADGNLASISGADINSFADGTDTPTPGPWAPPSGTYGNIDTYGHWGLTTEDTSLTDADSFGNALYAGNFINTPREVMHATSSADGTTPHIGTTRVGYKLEVTVMQEAATDYTTTLTYVVTPSF